MKLDFRTKLLMTIVISFILLLGNLHKHYFFLILLLSSLPYLLLLLDRKYLAVFKGLLFIGLASLLQDWLLTHSKASIFESVLVLITMTSLKMAPGLVMGRYSILTTSMSDLVASLQKMKLPDLLIVPISVMFRFFYTVKEDYQQIKEAMYLRGLTGRQFFRQPLRMLEYRYVPLLMCLSRTADDVAISAMTRGLIVGGPRTTISTTRLGFWDYLLISLMILVLLLDVWSRYVRV
ncbi:energy-coupling factor transporter transmembrane component T [Streptococcus oricebi]|uniref:Energy-coupling factor transporter transmembrane protein EcfT n=1 Tax=Streptococcus oricebi TaxID=1547447 RepID=A0ABS5B6A0_9STRE|nr:energy-coupling factor transporter transmembrane component T [Streptococcus oricebi]MBP2624003.1 energy-coupling factor transporter transmembrane protein EcfT [Streptococcus oricebi]